MHRRPSRHGSVDVHDARARADHGDQHTEHDPRNDDADQHDRQREPGRYLWIEASSKDPTDTSALEER
jgi:hypothetical protein